MTLSSAQQKILARVKRYPKGILLSPAEHRTAKALAAKGLIEYDERTGIAKQREATK